MICQQRSGILRRGDMVIVESLDTEIEKLVREAYEKLKKFEPKSEHDELRKDGALKGLWEALCYIRAK